MNTGSALRRCAAPPDVRRFEVLWGTGGKAFTRDVAGKRVEVTADILPSAMFGLPVTADQDKYLARQKIIALILQSEGEVKNPVRFKSADLPRLLNLITKTGKNYKEISDWLDVMSATTIISNGHPEISGSTAVCAIHR